MAIFFCLSSTLNNCLFVGIILKLVLNDDITGKVFDLRSEVCVHYRYLVVQLSYNVKSCCYFIVQTRLEQGRMIAFGMHSLGCLKFGTKGSRWLQESD